MYSDEDALSSLREASEILGHSPKRREYDELDLLPSASWITDNFDSWNNAKEAAGLTICEQYPQIDDVPDVIDLTQNEWESISATRRLQLRKSAKYAKRKMETGCTVCGFDKHPTALEYHHVEGDKEDGVGNMIRSNLAEERIDEEIEKCTVLCSNCHKMRTVDIYDTDKFNTIPE